MFQQQSTVPTGFEERSPANMFAERISAVGYDLSRFYCVQQGGEGLSERRPNLSSDHDYVYRARWYLTRDECVPGSDEVVRVSGQSDLMFYRETEDMCRLFISIRVQQGDGGEPDSISHYIVDERRPLDIWRQQVAELIPVVDNVLDDDPYLLKSQHAVINRRWSHYDQLSTDERAALDRCRLAEWSQGHAPLAMTEIDQLATEQFVPLNHLLSGRWSLAAVADAIDSGIELLNQVIEPAFEREYQQFRMARLETGQFSDSIADFKQAPILAGLSVEHERLLRHEAQQLAVDIEGLRACDRWGADMIRTLGLATASLPGPVAARLVLCMGAFSHPMFSDAVTALVAQESEAGATRSELLRLRRLHEGLETIEGARCDQWRTRTTKVSGVGSRF